MNDKENSGNEADVSEVAEDSISDISHSDISESDVSESDINESDTLKEVEGPKPLNLAPETVDQVWRYSEIPVCRIQEHWSDVVSSRSQIPLADHR